MENVRSYGIEAFRAARPADPAAIPLHLLQVQPIFQGLDAADLKTVAELLRPTTFAAGDFVFRQGGEPDGLYLLEDGEMLMWTRVCDSRLDIVRFQAGAPLCLASLMETGGLATSMEALAPSRVWVLDVGAFERLRLKAHPVAFRLLHAIAEEMGKAFAGASAHYRGLVGLSFAGTTETADPLPPGRAPGAADVPQLKVLPFFRGLGAIDLDAVCGAASWRELPRGHKLFIEGGPAGEMHLVLRGAVEATAEYQGGRRRLSMRGPGRWLGQDVFLTGTPQPYSAIAKERSTLLGFSRPAFDALYAQRQPAALRILEQLSAAFTQQFNGDLSTLMREAITSGEPLPLTSVQAGGTIGG